MCKCWWNNIYVGNVCCSVGRADLVDKESQNRLGSKARNGRIGYRSASGLR